MVIMENGWNPKDEIPTTRFWLMLKLKLGWDRRWNTYLEELRTRLMSMMTINGVKGEDLTKAKTDMARHIIEKLETSAWRTIPTPFLKDLGIPRVLRH